MTNVEIRIAINNANTNKDIRWSIVKNTPTEIVLTNSYDKCVNFSIRVDHDDDDEWVIVRDNHMETTVGLFCKGLNIWDDYNTTEQGLTMGVESAVRNFNNTY